MFCSKVLVDEVPSAWTGATAERADSVATAARRTAFCMRKLAISQMLAMKNGKNVRPFPSAPVAYSTLREAVIFVPVGDVRGYRCDLR